MNEGAIISPAMPPATFKLTDEQSQAVTTTGRSLIVSAAAGSGKTAVLAERCAYLVCDAPPDERCDVDALLVLTFTDAAAAQMRSRIVDAIRRRLDERPDDARLRRQLALVDAAQISTIHSFCLWLVRRWFTHVDLDPTAAVLDADEASLLKKEVLDELFTELYATVPAADDPLGSREIEPPRPDVSPVEDLSSWELGRRSLSALGPAFVRLVDDYGLGEDRDIAVVALKLYEFTTSLPDGPAWLREAVESLVKRPELVVSEIAAALGGELQRQAEHCAQLVETLQAGDPTGYFYADRIREYEEQVRGWLATLAAIAEGSVAETLAQFDRVCRHVAEFEFTRKQGPKLPKDIDPKIRALRDAASELYSKQVKERLFKKRLKSRFALFTVEEWIAGLRQTATYVAALVDVVATFQEAYARRKRRLNVLDFADLERFAFDLLRASDRTPSASAGPSRGGLMSQGRSLALPVLLETLRPGDDSPAPSDAARALHQRFAHVLVDEFQDINPIQQAILRFVSRETDPTRPGNLFVVGDVKQSIYRFRLAEPALFTERLRRFSAGDDGKAIYLQSNFRSRSEILEAVNGVFRQLMREGLGDLVYDKAAELRPGRVVAASPRQPVELHVLEQRWRPAPDDEENGEEPSEAGIVDASDPSRWTSIEREAFLIGSHIRRWTESGESPTGATPPRFSDIAVLLRATKINAERTAAMLTSMGIPAYADVGGSLFSALEIRDVVAALRLLDNFQQDIPLAAVLRSGVIGERLSEDELVEIRCLDRDVPFHAVVRDYARRGGDAALRGRVAAFVERINRYRDEARRRPPAELLWHLYEDQGYMAYAAGLPNGVQRRANLLKLHQLARKFGSFRRQGLHRFLRFIESLQDEEQEVALAPSLGESDDVVRVMSIHQAKGLEFPVVFVAGLGTKFNLGDRRGRIIFERKAKIGLRVVDTQRMIEYPSAAHSLVADEIERTTREEELRILYTAMTRARDLLVLVGSIREAPTSKEVGHPARGSGAGRHPPTLWSIAAAERPLDWLLPALADAPESLVELHTHDVEEMSGWRVTEPRDADAQRVRTAVSRCDALPPDEPLAPNDPEVERVLSRIDFVYPHLSSTSIRATMAASEFKGVYDFLRDPDERPDLRRERDAFQVPPSKYAPQPLAPSAYRGVMTHRVLQHLDFTAATDAAGVASELQRMLASGVIGAADRAVVDEAGLTWFVTTPLADLIRRAGTAYRREFRYVAVEPLTAFDRSVDARPEDRVLVRGIVDGILPTDDGLMLVDFKTDAVTAEEVQDRGERYRPQMTLYARAMEELWRRPVQAIWLVFLTPRQVLECTADFLVLSADPAPPEGRG
ncbi:MAG: UvrD-helicase domain-containing protein [Planctomycetota bacterium]